jgi:hypothetical protein
VVLRARAIWLLLVAGVRVNSFTEQFQMLRIT